MDVDALIAALEAPQITVGGETYTGKVLSLHQILPLLARFEAMGDEDVDIQNLADLLSDTFGAAGFPPEVLEQIPLGVIPEVLEDFFRQAAEAAPKNRKTRRATKSTA